MANRRPVLRVHTDGSVEYEGVALARRLPAGQTLRILLLLSHRLASVPVADLGRELWHDRWREQDLAKAISRARRELRELGISSPVIEARRGTGYAIATRLDVRTNLSQVRTSLVREDLVEEVAVLVERSQLVTLHGPGGVGKSRVAAEIGWRFRTPRFADGVWFVALDPLPRGDSILPSIARAMELAPGDDVEKTLLRYLRRRSCLLVLDGLERLIPTITPVVNRLLIESPRLHVLATSVRPLGLGRGRGEVLEVPYAVQPLELPRVGPRADLANNPSVRLFVDRARETTPTYDPTRDLPEIAEVCRLMGGLPLGICIAAARTRTFGIGAVLALLHQRVFAADEGGIGLRAKDTLWGTINWSFELLSPEARRLLAWLSIFPNGIAFDHLSRVWAAASKGGGPAAETTVAAHDLMDELVTFSLVLHEDRGGGDHDRYTLLEPVRQFALEQLGEDRSRAEEFEARLSLELAQRANGRMSTTETAVWLGRLESERENLGSAAEWFRLHDEGQSELILDLALAGFWIARGDWTEGRRAFDSVLADESIGTPTQRANALNRAAGLARNQAEYTAARELYGRALSLATALEPHDLWNESYALNGLGRIEASLGNSRRARRNYERALLARRRLGRKPAVAITLVNLAELDRLEGNLTAAARRHDEAHRLRHEDGDLPGIAISHLMLGLLRVSENELAKGASCIRDALKRFQALGYRDWTARVLEAMSELAARAAQPEAAVVLRAAAASLDERLGTRKSPFELSRDALSVNGLRAVLREGSFRDAWKSGAALSLDAAYQYATDLGLGDLDTFGDDTCE